MLIFNVVFIIFYHFFQVPLTCRSTVLWNSIFRFWVTYLGLLMTLHDTTVKLKWSFKDVSLCRLSNLTNKHLLMNTWPSPGWNWVTDGEAFVSKPHRRKCSRTRLIVTEKYRSSLSLFSAVQTKKLHSPPLYIGNCRKSPNLDWNEPSALCVAGYHWVRQYDFLNWVNWTFKNTASQNNVTNWNWRGCVTVSRLPPLGLNKAAEGWAAHSGLSCSVHTGPKNYKGL